MLRPPSRLGPAALRPSHLRPGNAVLPLALRHRPDPPAPPPADPLARDPKLARVETALMAADEPLTARRLADVCGLADAAEARALVARLTELLDADGSAFAVGELAGGYQLLTRPAYHPWLVRLRRAGHEVRLAPAALETLAVVAYRQPVTRAEVERVRGVGCGELIRVLMEKGLVRTAGRDQSLGRPPLYATTRQFLRAFGLNALADLPDADALRGGRPDVTPP
ncbi:MAG: SMC-Scp complex subunit ScpB [Gemmataceae bacterium]|nr:SMC-Scp complex subunit ScpB [Gemmataceae bacterium]